MPARRRSSNIAFAANRALSPMSVFMPSFFWPVYSSSDERPPPYDTVKPDLASFYFIRMRLFGKRLGILWWRLPNNHKKSSDADHVDFLVLGDSYADDIDMGFRTWPGLLASTKNGTCLNVSLVEAADHGCTEQLDRADRWMAESNKRVSDKTQVLIHLGGNDILHALQMLGPFAILLLFFDLYMLAAARWSWRPRMTALPKYSFFGFLARRITSSLTTLIGLLGKRGYTKVLVASVPLSASMPLPRIMITCMTWAWVWRGSSRSKLVTDLLDDASELLDSHVSAALEEAARANQIQLQYFDEGGALRKAACKLHENDLSKVRMFDSMWKDAHHPRQWVHAELAKAAEAVLKEQDKEMKAVKKRQSKSPARR